MYKPNQPIVAMDCAPFSSINLLRVHRTVCIRTIVRTNHWQAYTLQGPMMGWLTILNDMIMYGVRLENMPHQISLPRACVRRGESACLAGQVRVGGMSAVSGSSSVKRTVQPRRRLDRATTGHGHTLHSLRVQSRVRSILLTSGHAWSHQRRWVASPLWSIVSFLSPESVRIFAQRPHEV